MTNVQIAAADRAVDHTSESDQSLMIAVRNGDRGAADRLRSRHVGAVQVLGDVVSPEAVIGSWKDLVAGLEAGASLDQPVRVAWMSRITQMSGGHLPDPTDAIWSSFDQLSSAWQVALWHHDVDADSRAFVADLLGLGKQDVPRTVLAARAALRRGVARRHGAGFDPECLRIAEHLRVDTTTTLDSGITRSMREHARHCDDCLPLVRDVFRVSFGLREHLADQVLGASATEYLRSRPRPVRVTGGTPLGGNAFVIAKRSRRPMIGLALGGLTAMAVIGALAVRAPGPDGLIDAVPGTAPARIGANQLTMTSGSGNAAPIELVSRTTAAWTQVVDASDIAPPVREPGAKDSNSTDEAPGSVDETDPTGPVTPVVPNPTDGTDGETPPVDDGGDNGDDNGDDGGDDGGDNGGDNGGPETGPPNSGPDLDADIDPSTGSVSVSVTVPGAAPIVVTTPPVLDVPVLPGAGVGVGVGGLHP